MRRMMLHLIGVGVLASFLGGLAVAQEKKPDATLKLTERDVAIGVGFSWGKGTLNYKGKTYPVKVEGLSVGEVGVNQATAVGNVYNLKKLEDFNGTYTAVGAGATVAGGGSVATMRNQNGVRVTLRSTSRGIKFTLGASGVTMNIKQ